jgi:hypothetical protein
MFGSRAHEEDRMSRRQKGLVGLAFAGLVGLAATKVMATPPTESPCPGISLADPRNESKVSLCHFTGSGFVLNEPSVSSLDTHIGHHGDCYKLFGQPQVCIE